MQLFNYDGPLMTVIRKLLSILTAGILFLVVSIPLITAGCAFTALYDTAERNLKHDRGYVAREFLASLKSNWRQALPAGAVMAVVMAVFEADIFLMKAFLENGNAIGNMFVLFRVLEALLLVYGVWVFAQISCFDNGMKQILKNALLLMVRHLPASLMILLLLAFAGAVIYVMPLSALFMPVVAVWLMTAVLEPIFKAYQ